MSSSKAKATTQQQLTKIKVLRSHPELAYQPGETGELPAEKAQMLLDGGFIELVTKSETAE